MNTRKKISGAQTNFLNQANFTDKTESLCHLTSLSLSETSLLETIRDPKNPARVLFLLWEGGRVSIVPYLQKDGKVCTPPEIEFAAHADLRLPDGILPCGDSRELLAELGSTICNFVDLSEEDNALVSLYVMSSW